MAVEAREAPLSVDAAAPGVEFDPGRMAIGPQGVTPFYAPVGIDELHAVRDSFLTGLFAWLREQDIDRSRDAEVLWLCVPQIVMEAMRLFHAQALQRRLRGAGYVLPDNGGSLFERIADGQENEPSIFMKVLRRGLQRDPRWRKAARALKSAYRSDGLPYRPRAFLRPARDIVTFSASDLVIAHARRESRPVFLSKFDEWLTPGSIGEDALPEGIGSTARDALIRLTDDAFKVAGESLSEALMESLARLAKSLTQRVGFYLEELRGQSASLPRQLWVGSSGIVYNRLMARAVRSAGGEVVGHDHGTGSGWWQTYYQTITELNYVDRFVTYSDAMAAGLRKSFRPDLLPSADRVCAIESIASSTAAAERRQGPAPTVIDRPAERAKPGKTAMYVPTAYTGDRVYLQPLLPDLVAVDWQARLFAYLRSEGYDILVKPHPESPYPIPLELQERFGFTVVEGPFEQVADQADLLVFDYLQTSCIVSALNGDRPIVLIEFPRLRLDPEARALLSKRAAIVPGGFDDEGRAEVDWEALGRAFESAALLTDNAFVERYYPTI